MILENAFQYGIIFILVQPAQPTWIRHFSSFTGTILVDGVDISHVSLPILRSRMAVIPQDPTIFGGTLRFNLDPACKYSDPEIWRVLESVRLKVRR